MSKYTESETLTELYRQRFPAEFLIRKNQIWRVICNNFLQQFISHDDVVIDVACGYGEFINNINCNKKIAIDLNNDAQGYLDPGVQFYQIAATELSQHLEGKGDIIFTSNFLEHLPDKKTLNAFLREVNFALRPGGKYIILGPNLRYLPGKYWDFYDHNLGLTHLSLTEALLLNNFKIITCFDRFLPYTTQSNLPTHPFFVSVYLKLPILWRFFGKQFFIVAQKINSDDML